jgi:hypothetical protein
MAKFYRFNLKGELLAEKTFDEFSYQFGKNEEFVPVRKGKKWGVVLNDSLEIIIPIQYDSIFQDNYSKSNLLAVKENNELFYIDINNKVIIDSKHRYISNELQGISSENGLQGFVNINGKILLEPKYNKVIKLLENRFLLQKDNYFILANGKGEIISNQIVGDRVVDKRIKINNEWAINYFLLIRNEKYFGVLDSDFIEVLECKYDDYINFTNNDTFFAVLNNVNLVLNKQNQVVKEFDFTFVFRSEVKMQNGKYCYIIQKDKSYEAKYGLLNENYELIVPLEYNYIEHSNSVFLVKKGRSEYLLNEKFEIIPNVKYKEIGRYEEEGIACAKDEDLKYRFIDFKGNILSEYVFDAVYMGDRRSMLNNLFESGFQNTYKSGLCGVLLNSKWGYVDLYGKLVIECKFDEITEFNSRNNAIVKYMGKWGVVDIKGKTIVDFNFENIIDYNLDLKLIVCKKNEFLGMINFDNIELIPFSFTNLRFNDTEIIYGYSKKQIAIRLPVQKKIEPIQLLESKLLDKHNTLLHEDLLRVMVMAVVSGEEDNLSNRLYIIDIIRKDLKSATFISGYAGGGVWDECTFINEQEYNGEEGGFTIFDYVRDDEVVKGLVGDYICEIDDELDEYQYKSLKHFKNVGDEDLKLLYSVWYNDLVDYSDISKNDKKRFKKLLKSTGISWKDWNFKF